MTDRISDEILSIRQAERSSSELAEIKQIPEIWNYPEKETWNEIVAWRQEKLLRAAIADLELHQGVSMKNMTEPEKEFIGHVEIAARACMGMMGWRE